MKKIYVFIVLISLFAIAKAQNSIDEVLQSIETNNKELQANSQLIRSQILEAKTDNNLDDPSVQYVRQWNADDKNNILGELVVTQSFDFPTLYSSRAKMNRMKAAAYSGQGNVLRQDILLQAKELCLDIIMLRQEREILLERLSNANSLSKLYEQRLAAGDANILETNKIALELLNVKTEAKLNETTLRNKLQELTALNGNVPIDFNAITYPAVVFPIDYQTLKNEVIDSDPALQSLAAQGDALQQQISVSKQGWIPKLEVGYRRNTETGPSYNGIVVGGSIPLFQNKNKVKIAKAQLLNNDLLKDNAMINIDASLAQNYQDAQSLYESMNEYQKTFQSQQSLALLKQALTGGQISMIEYFVEVSVIYQSKLNYLQLENQYQKAMALIYKTRL